jgi:dTMP kinase
MPDTSPTPGFLLSFEGSEGCGKSTQIRLLRERLEQSGRRVEVLREPGGTEIGESIRHLLQHSKEGAAMTPEAELLLFAASRAQIVREKIRPLLEAGVFVILDRFLDSTSVYQGHARGLPLDAVNAINRFAIGGTLPQLIPLQVAQSTDAAVNLLLATALQVAEEANAALPLTVVQVLGVARETNQAPELLLVGQLGVAEETNQAVALPLVLQLQPGNETDEAVELVISAPIVLGVAQEQNRAITLQSPSTGGSKYEDPMSIPLTLVVATNERCFAFRPAVPA